MGGMELPASVGEWLVSTGVVAQAALLPGRGDAVRLDDEASARFETGTVRGRAAASARSVGALTVLTAHAGRPPRAPRRLPVAPRLPGAGTRSRPAWRLCGAAACLRSRQCTDSPRRRRLWI
jgi:hypothetical protein